MWSSIDYAGQQEYLIGRYLVNLTTWEALLEEESTNNTRSRWASPPQYDEALHHLERLWQELEAVSCQDHCIRHMCRADPMP
jgi:hypothetical protein